TALISIYTLSLHDALPIFRCNDNIFQRISLVSGSATCEKKELPIRPRKVYHTTLQEKYTRKIYTLRFTHTSGATTFFNLRFLGRSEEHTSELQSRENVVCR